LLKFKYTKYFYNKTVEGKNPIIKVQIAGTIKIKYSIPDTSVIVSVLLAIEPLSITNQILTKRTGKTKKKIINKIHDKPKLKCDKDEKNKNFIANMLVPGKPIVTKQTNQPITDKIGFNEETPLIDDIDLVPNLL
jgi:hypothetical protein